MHTEQYWSKSFLKGQKWNINLTFLRLNVFTENNFRLHLRQQPLLFLSFLCCPSSVLLVHWAHNPLTKFKPVISDAVMDKTLAGLVFLSFWKIGVIFPVGKITSRSIHVVFLSNLYVLWSSSKWVAWITRGGGKSIVRVWAYKKPNCNAREFQWNEIHGYVSRRLLHYSHWMPHFFQLSGLLNFRYTSPTVFTNQLSRKNKAFLHAREVMLIKFWIRCKDNYF